MFNDQRQNNYNNAQKQNVYTRVFSSYSDTCHFYAVAWNDSISLRFLPKVGTDDRGLTVYADQNAPESKKTALVNANAKTLYLAIKKEILPALENKTAKSVAVFIGSAASEKKSITIATDGTNITITYAAGLDDANRATDNNMITHKFNSRSVGIDYSPETGNGVMEEIPSEFYGFLDILSKVYEVSLMMHAVNYAGKSSQAATTSNNYRTSYNQQAPMNPGAIDPGTVGAPVLNIPENQMDDFLQLT